MTKEKKFNHNKIEVCNLCKKEFDTEEVNWTTVIDYTAETLRSIKFYHTSCLKSLVEKKGKKVKQELEDRFENKARDMIGKIREKLTGEVPA